MEMASEVFIKPNNVVLFSDIHAVLKFQHPPLPKKPSSYESLESSRSFYLISFDIKYVFCFIWIICEKNKFAVYQRHRYSTSVYSQCAMRCVFTTQCLSFFYNHVDLLCQSEGNIYLSFTDGSGNYWMYYDKN